MDGAVVLNWGSDTIKGGQVSRFPSDNEPYVVTPAAVRRRSGKAANGDGAQDLPDDVSRLVQRGNVLDWDGLEQTLQYVLYDQLGWQAGDEGNMLLAEAQGTPKTDRETATQLMFETFNVAGLFIADEPVLSLYAHGKLTGCVIDFGHGKTDIATVIEGQQYLPGSRQLPYGGQDVTAMLGDMLAKRGARVPDEGGLTRLKELAARLRGGGEEDEAKPVRHKLPDGQSITVRPDEAQRLGEALLQPSSLDPDFEGPDVAESAVISALAHQEPALRKAVLENIVVCGGSSAVPGLGQRCVADMRALLPASATPGIVACPEYMPAKTLQRSVWMGGAILAKVIFQQNYQVTKWEYEELGPAAVHRKCMS